MDLFLDLYGFLSVVLHAAELMARSVLVGAIAFLGLLAVPLSRRLVPSEGAMLIGAARRAVLWGGWLTLGAVALSAGLGAVALIGTLELPASQALSAGFVLSALGVMAAARAGSQRIAAKRYPSKREAYLASWARRDNLS